MAMAPLRGSMPIRLRTRNGGASPDVCSEKLLRARPTRMQNELPAEERAGNVAGAFRVRGRLDGRRILLVDDVTTTGSTLEACGAAAISAGAAAVYAAVVARADGGGSPDA